MLVRSKITSRRLKQSRHMDSLDGVLAGCLVMILSGLSAFDEKCTATISLLNFIGELLQGLCLIEIWTDILR